MTDANDYNETYYQLINKTITLTKHEKTFNDANGGNACCLPDRNKGF